MNTCANLFHSESELRAALGSAAILDPIKHPRRWEQEFLRKRAQSRARFNSDCDAAQALMSPRAIACSLTLAKRRAEKAERIRELSHMSTLEIAEHTGWSIHTIRKICAEHHIKCARPRKESNHDQ